MTLNEMQQRLNQAWVDELSVPMLERWVAAMNREGLFIVADDVQARLNRKRAIENHVAEYSIGNPDAPVLKSIANSIEVMFPDSADILRHIARKMND